MILEWTGALFPAIHLPHDLIEPFLVGLGKRSSCRLEDEQIFLLGDNSFLIGGDDITFQHVIDHVEQALVAIDALRRGPPSTVFTHGSFGSFFNFVTLLTAPSASMIHTKTTGRPARQA
jgi:hypothetical protein